MALEYREFPHRSCNQDGAHVAFNRLETPNSYRIHILSMIFSSLFFSGIVSAQEVGTNFIIQSNEYNCSANLICLGQAHPYVPTDQGETVTGILEGTLALLYKDNMSAVGVAYYNKPVKFRDLATQRSAAFSTWFTIDVRNDESWNGEGMTFVISASNSSIGLQEGYLGIFDASFSTSSFKSIVVEFDSFLNAGFPVNDINNNHVSFDFNNITAIATVDASPVVIDDLDTKYAWVDYSDETQQLEVRLSYSPIRPDSPIMNYTVNLFDYVEEYMWVGFSSSSGGANSSSTSTGVINYYVGDWIFNSTLGSMPAPTPSSAAPLKAFQSGGSKNKSAGSKN
ncbi:unnamed protein product [Calypogeia fissa]